MAICTKDTLLDAAECYRCFDAHDRVGLLLYFKVLELAAVGGTDYTAELGADGDLNTAAAAFNTLNSFEMELAELAIAQNNAEAAGAVVPVTIPLIKDAMLCLKCFPPHVLKLMLLLVECELGEHAAQPQ